MSCQPFGGVSLLARTLLRQSVGILQVDLVCVRAGANESWRRWSVPVEKDVTLDHVRKPQRELMMGHGGGGDGEHLVEFLKSELLGLRNQEEDHDPSQEIESSVETKGPDVAHGGDHGREGKTEDASKERVDANCPGHTLLAMDGREDFGRVLESDWAFTKGIEDSEEVDETVNEISTICRKESTRTMRPGQS